MSLPASPSRPISPSAISYSSFLCSSTNASNFLNIFITSESDVVSFFLGTIFDLSFANAPSLLAVLHTLSFAIPLSGKYFLYSSRHSAR